LQAAAEHRAIDRKEMDTMRKMLIAALAGALVALSVGVLTGAGAVSGPGSDDD
jgi:hypothetical protein